MGDPRSELAALAGVDPWADVGCLDAGSPEAVEEIADSFRRSASRTTEAADAALAGRAEGAAA